MKTAVISSPLIASKNMQGSIMGMDANGTAMASMFLRDKIYSNKILAVIREYGCNGMDEHKKHGVDRPVEMGLRKDGNDNTFYVRDFAKGLSEDDIRNVFGMYFRSTKSGTNEMIGGFGIGSKAGHCYNDTFFVTSHHEGVKRVFTCMLGGSDSGVPVGHIYEIGEGVPTQESGLEISLPVNYLDINRFTSEMVNFVKACPSGIVATTMNGEKVEPNPVIFSTKLGEYTLRTTKGTQSHYAILQMGGVTYGTMELPNRDYRINAYTSLIIDIPVGKMSIPISREAFEETPSNERVKDEIKSLLAEFMENDLAKFKDKSFSDLVEDHTKNMSDMHVDFVGQVFSIRKSSMYRNEHTFLTKIGTAQNFSNAGLEKKDDKKILIIIPSNMAEKYWRAKLREFCASEGKNYLCTTDWNHDQYYNSPQGGKNINEAFHVMKIKSLPFPKVKRDSKRYSIYGNNGPIGSKSPLELHQHSLQSTLATDAKSAKKQCEEIVKKAKSIRDLRSIVITEKSYTSRNPDNIGFYTSSMKFLNEMVELGWYNFNSDEYRKKATELREVERVEAEKRNALIYAKKRWLKLGDRTHRLINGDSRNAMRVLKVWQGLSKEDSTRGKVLKSIENSSYGSQLVYTRNELRAILSLK